MQPYDYLTTNRPMPTGAEIFKGAPIPLLDHGSIRYIAHMGDDQTPLEAARMSTGNPTGVDAAKDAATRDYLWRHAHATPFEMTALQIEVQCPIFVAREWMRHRVPFSYNEYSQRYSEALELYYVPSDERVASAGQSTTNKQGSGEALDPATVAAFRASVAQEQQEQREAYRGYLDDGIARELSRLNMPVSNYTRFRVQSNLRGWFNFISLRIRDNAQYEIRVYAQAIADLIKLVWPASWAVYEEHTLEGVTLSRSERELVRGLLSEALGANDPGALALLLEGKIGSTLNKSKTREFLAKLGLPPA